MTKPNVMRDQLALRRFATMRNRSNAMQARRGDSCNCLKCLLRRSLGASLGDAMQRAAEDEQDTNNRAAIARSKAH